MQTNKKMPARIPTRKKPETIREWVENAPSSKVTRVELMRVLDGFGFIPREGVVVMFRDYDRIRRQMQWYRRLWRWLKLKIPQKKTLADLDPSAREAVRQQLDKADQEQAAKLTEEKVEERHVNSSPHD